MERELVMFRTPIMYSVNCGHAIPLWYEFNTTRDMWQCPKCAKPIGAVDISSNPRY